MGQKTKQVVLIRHAKSLAQQTTPSVRRSSLLMRDVILSDEGREAMIKLGRSAAEDGRFQSIDTVLCSPMTRAIETACYVYADIDCRILIIPELAEFAKTKRMAGYENTGRSYEELIHDENLRSLPKFNDIDFTLIKEYEANYGTDWWSSGYLPAKSEAQIERLKKIIYALPDNRIGVVGHCINMMKLLNTMRRIPNGTPIWCELRKSNGSLKLHRSLFVPKT